MEIEGGKRKIEWSDNLIFPFFFLKKNNLKGHINLCLKGTS